MQPFAGAGPLLAEPLVGEVVALRTFRVEQSGLLLPLFSENHWFDGPNTATCPRSDHAAPGDDCDCGFYAYASPEAAAQNRGMRHVQAVVSCWGGVVAGSQGVRAQHARIDALWLHPSAPDWLRSRVAARYPSARLHDHVETMLATHPLSVLPSYGPPRPRDRGRRVLAGVPVAAALALGAVPGHVLHAHPLLRLTWWVAVGLAVLLTVWLAAVARFPGRLVAVAMTLALTAWLVAPVCGLAGWLLRLPVLRGVLVGIGGYLATLRPHYFPVVVPVRERVYYGARV